MEIKQMKNLEKGDIVVEVRDHYQNYDHTLVPCEPKMYTVSAIAMDIHLEEVVKHSFVKDGTRYVNAGGCDRGLFCAYFETLEDYLSGNYEKDIILDKQRWGNAEEFLRFKMEEDHKRAREAEDARVAAEDKKLRA